MLELTQVSNYASDCTAVWAVEYSKSTLAELIEDIVIERKGDWGSVRIGYGFNDVIEYNHGKYTITNEQQYEQYKDKPIVKIRAYGGWTYMTYNVIYEESK